MTAPSTAARPRTGRALVQIQDADRHVGRRMRERRIALGLTQLDVAERVGITSQQLHKYERGVNRMAAGRLYAVAQALDVSVAHFFEGLGSSEAASAPAPQRRGMLELARDFAAIPDERQRQVLCDLARVLANPPELDAAA